MKIFLFLYNTNFRCVSAKYEQRVTRYFLRK